VDFGVKSGKLLLEVGLAGVLVAADILGDTWIPSKFARELLQGA
jgi:hypothetical protein